MGYRLGITNKDKTIDYYGTKHYGYTFEIAEKGAKHYPSVKYLIDLGKLEPNTIFDYCLSPQITLTADEFEKFIKLYAKEIKILKHFDFLLIEEIQALLKDKSDKILDWS